MYKTENSLITTDNLKWFTVAWTFVIILPLIYFPASSLLTGHPWKVELGISLLLFPLTIFLHNFLKQQNELIIFSNSFQSNIIIPCVLFTVWSGLSMFWASSVLSVMHHTLVWCVYLICFIFLCSVISRKRILRHHLLVLSTILTIIAFLSIIEFLFSGEIGKVFGFRYSRYTEIFAAIIPLITVFVIRSKGKYYIFSCLALGVLWLSILFVGNRTSLIAVIATMSVFFLARVLLTKNAFEKKRLAVSASIFVIIFIFLQLPFVNTLTQNDGTLSKIKVYSKADASNSVSQNVRLFYYDVGLEMFSDNYLKGVGADNFGIRFNRYRAVYSAKGQNSALLNHQEELTAERTHNEYLQIVTELGLVGGLLFLLILTGIFRLGIYAPFKNKKVHSDILTQAAIAGVFAFLISSLFSSYSFRLMQNGLVFFFLVSIILRKHIKIIDKPEYLEKIPAPNFQFLSLALSLTVCFALAAFSASKATSQFLTYQAERTQNAEDSKTLLKKATVFDPDNAAAYFLHGFVNLNEKNYSESAAYFDKSIHRGLNSSVEYSYLMSAQILNNDLDAAEQTALKNVEIFPYSVFARTRYAAILKMRNKSKESNEQLAFAHRINADEAKTWWILLTEGARIAGEKSVRDAGVLKLYRLLPQEGIHAYLIERETLHPEEKVQFNFRK